ncbi:MAG TPA: dihydrofolate reductase family protein [Phycisphaerae bacterium]|nr:dihydrofolate reductase family protein [Phycisphaerae bacterium]HRW53156.1 dihydrofolate reductase family protein [Phycisphaerae bacterium]
MPSESQHPDNAPTSESASRVTIHMVASLDGFIARKDGSVDWLEMVSDYEQGDELDAVTIQAVLDSIDCYVMGSRTYETAMAFEAKGFGWAYGDKPTFVLTTRQLAKARESVEFCSGDLAQLVSGRLRRQFAGIWFVGGGAVSGACLRLGLADEVRYSVMPVLIGEGIPFFQGLDNDIPLRLVEVKAYRSGMVSLRHEVKGGNG